MAQQHRATNPPLPIIPVSARAMPPFDGTAVRELLQQAKSSAFMQQLDALTRLAKLLEDEEAVFREVTGDPWAIPNQRAGFNIGRILAIIKVRGLPKHRRRGGGRPAHMGPSFHA